MREIKFRGKRESDGMWVFGNFTNVDDQVCMIHSGKRHHFIERESVGQYTGLEDSKGDGIYEGDIIEFLFRDYDECGEVLEERFRRGYVHFSFGQWSVRLLGLNAGTNLYGIGSKKVIIIGNIYDDKSFLEEEQQ